jgi:hypothetical protein
VADQLLLLLAGFVLTTVAGGFLGFWLQGRAWRRQEEARLKATEGEAARAFFEDLSRLLDQRLHRTRQLDDWLGRPGEKEAVQQRLAHYRDAVDEWNLNWNRILSLAKRYFGEELRHYLDYELGQRFVDAGRRVEARVREYQTDAEASSPALTSEHQALKYEVIALNVRLIEAVQRGEVGRFHPQVAAETKGLEAGSRLARGS